MFCIFDTVQRESIERLVEASLKLNTRIIELENEKNYRNKVLVINFISHIKHFKLKHIISRLKIRRNILRLPKDFDSNYDRCFPERNYFSDERIAIYSVLFGDYDKISEPVFVPDNCDFYLVTDQELPKESVWRGVDISAFDISGFTNVEKNRFFKMFPHLLFVDYKYSVYIDANIVVVGDLTAMVNCIGEAGTAFHSHRHRDCVYSEARAAQMLNKISKSQLWEYRYSLSTIKMPLHYGLPECNVIAREHGNPLCISLMNQWWKLFLHSSIKRDQLYLPIAMWHEKIKADEIETLGNDVYSNPLIRIIYHN